MQFKLYAGLFCEAYWYQGLSNPENVILMRFLVFGDLLSGVDRSRS